MQWIVEHLVQILGFLLSLSEAAAVFCLVFFPQNKGVAGVIAGIIKLLVTFGAKKPELEQKE